MSKLKIAIWYSMVILDVMFLIISILKKDVTLAACAFFLSMWLSKNHKEVPLPKIYEKLMFRTKL